MLITGEIRVEPHGMESRPAYNRLMISPLVYEDLQGYTHMLIHEPDALVVRDELDVFGAFSPTTISARLGLTDIMPLP